MGDGCALGGCISAALSWINNIYRAQVLETNTSLGLQSKIKLQTYLRPYMKTSVSLGVTALLPWTRLLHPENKRSEAIDLSATISLNSFTVQPPLVSQDFLIVEAARSHSRHTIISRHPLYEWSVRRRNLYLTHNTHKEKKNRRSRSDSK